MKRGRPNKGRLRRFPGLALQLWRSRRRGRPTRSSDHLGSDIARSADYPPGPGYVFAVRLATGEAPFPDSIGDYFWSGVGGTYFWVDPLRGFFVLLMMDVERRATSALPLALAALVYAALDP